jgi:hypothetical protein
LLRIGLNKITTFIVEARLNESMETDYEIPVEISDYTKKVVLSLFLNE